MSTPFIRFFAILAVSLVTTMAARAQSPFPVITPDGEEVRELPESVPTDLIEPRITSRETAADKLARIFNRELRDIEERQQEIFQELDELPETAIESFFDQAFGYHSGNSRSRPKWIQIDLGETVSPDAVALFPVTVQFNGETIFGYGFPRAFRIDISHDKSFKSYETVYEGRIEGSRRWPFFREIGGYEGRYLRVTATALWQRKGEHGVDHAFALSEIMVLKGERNLAVGKPVSYRDTQTKGEQWSHRYVNDGVTAFGIPRGKEKSPTIGYRSKSKSATTSSWVQIDLEESMPIQEVRIILADYIGALPDPTVKFPYPITVQVSDNPDMRKAETLGRFTPGQIAQKGNNPLILPVDDGYGRYVRLTVSQSEVKPMAWGFAELQVFSENRNVALGKDVIGSHPVTSKGVAPEFLVDGYSSGRSLVSYQSWVSNLEQRIKLERELSDIEKTRLDLVDRTFTRGVVSSITGLVGGLGLALVIFAQGRVKRRKDMEALRQRIASDLHDDIGSNLSSIALLAELGKTETGEPELVVEEFTEIKHTADKTIESMRDIVWLIRPGEETWKQMMTRFRETASKLLRAHEYSFIEKGQMHDDRLPLEFKRDFFLIYKEVLNNIVRHADAKNVLIEVETARGKLDLKIKDDGKGFDNLDHDFREGNGLRNLRMRAQAIGAKLKVKSSLDSGTLVQLTAPLP
ncbi:MAG: histidine kinase [Verrucomicrobiales bacterium]|nr:histidine kinase [Verrucomicrobiales bacterium]